MGKEEVVQGLVAGDVEEPENQNPNMPDGDEIVAFEDENGEDSPKALQEARSALARFEWDDSDILFSFNKIEIEMAAVGVKKNFSSPFNCDPKEDY